MNSKTLLISTHPKYPIAIAVVGVLFFAGAYVYSEQSSIAPYRFTVMNQSLDLDSQIRATEKKLESNPNGQIVTTDLADLYLQKAKIDDQYLLFEKAETLAIQSLQILEYKNERAKMIKADVAQARHEFKKSIEICETVLSTKVLSRSNRVRALSTLITSQLATGRLDDAEKNSQILTRVSPSTASLIQRALVAEAKGQVESAIGFFKNALSFESFGDAAMASRLRAMWARVYLRIDKINEAKQLLNESLRITPKDPLSLALMGELNIQQKDYTQAEKYFSQAYTNSKKVIYLIGNARALRLGGETNAENETLENINQLVHDELKQPDAFAHRSERIKFFLLRGEPEDLNEAVTLAEKDAVDRPNAAALYLLANTYYRTGRIDEVNQADQIRIESDDNYAAVGIL